MNDKKCPICDGFGTIDQGIIDGICAECGGAGVAKDKSDAE